MRKVKTSSTPAVPQRPEPVRFRLTKRAMRRCASMRTLVQKVIKLLEAPVPYLRAVDAERHRAMLQNFLRFESDYSSELRLEATLPWGVYALEQWAMSLLAGDSEASPLLAIAALDTGCLMMHCIDGYSAAGWRIEPMLDDPFDPRPLRQFADAAFKRFFSRKLNSVIAVAQVPAGEQLTTARDVPVLSAGSEFLFRIKRCPLSWGPYDHLAYSHLWTGDVEHRQFDREEDFAINGHMLVHGEGSRCYSSSEFLDAPTRLVRKEEPDQLRFAGIGFALPLRWLVGVTYRDARGASGFMPVEWK